MMTHSFLALKGFQIVSKFKPPSAGQRVACGQLDDQSLNTHNSFSLPSRCGEREHFQLPPPELSIWHLSLASDSL